MSNKNKIIKPLPPLQCIQNFPYVDESINAINNWQLLQKVWAKCGEVIDLSNLTQEQQIELYNYVTNYFSQLDVQDEIDKKLDSMVTDGSLTTLINNYFNNVNKQISSINNKVNSIVTPSPAGVFSTLDELESSQNTDKNRIYVVQETGNWYYWNGTNWVSGGTYQATKIADNSINNFQTQFLKQGKNKLLFLNTIAKGINVSMQENGHTSFAGTASSAPAHAECGQFYIDTIEDYILEFKIFAGSKPTFFIYDENDELIFTIPMATNKMTLNFKKTGLYTIKLYVPVGNNINCELYGSLMKSSDINISDFFRNYFKSSYMLNKTNELDIEKNPIFKLLNYTILNTFKNTIGIIDTRNVTLQFEGQNYIVYNRLYNPYIDTEDKIHVDYRRLDILNPNINNKVELIKENSLNICYLDKNCEVQSVGFTDFATTIDINDIILFTYFCSGNKIVSINTFDNNFQILGLVNNRTDFNNLSFNAIGDSLTYGFITSTNRLTTPYPEAVKNQLNLAGAYNNGVSGSTIANINQYSISSDERLNNYENAGVIAIMGGTNDYYNNIELGNLETEAENNFYGGYKKILNKLITNNPTSFIFTIIPPCSRYQANRLNEQNYSWLDMSNAIKEISKYFGVACLDMNSLGQLGYVNKNTWTVDGTHFNQEYVSNVFAPKVANFIYNNIQKLPN